MHEPVLERMDTLIARWEANRDPRWVFLSCYRAMTANMLTSVAQRDFLDSAWVDRLLHRFADYYFDALEAFERDPATAPAVWTMTFSHDG